MNTLVTILGWVIFVQTISYLCQNYWSHLFGYSGWNLKNPNAIIRFFEMVVFYFGSLYTSKSILSDIHKISIPEFFPQRVLQTNGLTLEFTLLYYSLYLGGFGVYYFGKKLWFARSSQDEEVKLKTPTPETSKAKQIWNFFFAVISFASAVTGLIAFYLQYLAPGN